MRDRLKNKVAAVTGAGRGIGRGMALAFASEGARVVVNDLGSGPDGSGSSTAEADAVVAEIKEKGGVAVANYDSVATSEGGNGIIKAAIDNFGVIDILVNNAGILRDRMLWNMTDEEWDDVIKTHLYGHFYCTRAAVIQMRSAIKERRQKRGTIINFSSDYGITGSIINANYCAAKMGVIGFTYSCALALWKYGINCNTILPSALTRLTAGTSVQTYRESALRSGRVDVEALSDEEIEARLKTGGSPDAVAPVVCWLASDEAQHINGQLFLATEGHIGTFSRIQEVNSTYKDGIFTMDETWRIMPRLTARLTNPAL